MYNRYIPQPDGSFQRNRVPEQPPTPPPRPAPPPQPSPPYPEPPKPCEPPPPRRPCQRRRPTPQKPPDTSVTGFLKRLLPKDFDTGDLLIVLLLLLMAGDCAEDQNTALLTLVIYLFL